VREKLKTAVINNLIIYGIFAIIGIAFVVYLYLKDKLNMEELTPVLMAASNAFGMFLVVIFLSHGLVAIPKELWR
jgi:ABC-type Mn2+/Zn2+ transport system permease subunit